MCLNKQLNNMKLIRIIDRFVKQIFREIEIFRHHIGFYLVDRETVSKVEKLPKLTAREKKCIKNTWSNLSINCLDYTWSRIWKMEHGFSPYMVGTMWTWSILEKINPYDSVVSLQNKALSDIYLSQIPFPKVYVRCIDGTMYDNEMHPIDLNKSISILQEIDSFIIKPSIDTLCGQGVLKICKEQNMEHSQVVLDAIKKSGNNFIAQESLKQHEDISRLNPTSINTCRVTTIYINGKISCSVALKVGKKDSFKDNWNSSYFIGVDPNGQLKSFGYDFYLNKVQQTDNGITFGGLQLPCFEKMINAVQEWHQQYLPQCGIVGWDVFVDNNDNITVIEVNLTCPGIVAEQLASGLFLEPYVNDICQKLKK